MHNKDMIKTTRSYDEWHASTFTMAYIDHVTPTNEAMRLLEKIPYKLETEVIGFRLQSKTLDIWAKTNLVTPLLFRQIEELGLTVVHALSQHIDGQQVTVIATYKKDGDFGEALPSHYIREDGTTVYI